MFSFRNLVGDNCLEECNDDGTSGHQWTQLNRHLQHIIELRLVELNFRLNFPIVEGQSKVFQTKVRNKCQNHSGAHQSKRVPFLLLTLVITQIIGVKQREQQRRYQEIQEAIIAGDYDMKL